MDFIKKYFIDPILDLFRPKADANISNLGGSTLPKPFTSSPTEEKQPLITKSPPKPTKRRLTFDDLLPAPKTPDQEQAEENARFNKIKQQLANYNQEAVEVKAKKDARREMVKINAEAMIYDIKQSQQLDDNLRKKVRNPHSQEEAENQAVSNLFQEMINKPKAHSQGASPETRQEGFAAKFKSGGNNFLRNLVSKTKGEKGDFRSQVTTENDPNKNTGSSRG